jgi:hypothetical protein
VNCDTYTPATHLGLGDHSLSELGYDADWGYGDTDGRFSFGVSSWSGSVSLLRVLEEKD